MKAQELLDHTPWTKGKYKGKTADQVSEIDPSYLVWAYDTWSPKPCSKVLADSCREDVAASRNFGEDEDSGLQDTFDRFNGDL